MKRASYLKLVALCLSDGGIGFSSNTMYIHFTNTSEVLLDLFKREIRKFSESKIHKQIKPRGITLRIFDKKLVRALLNISPSYRTRPCNHFPICPFLKKDRKYGFGNHKHFKQNGLIFAKTTVPEYLFQTLKDRATFMRIYASCDGYPSIFPRKSSWSAVERIVAIVCHHPILKTRLHEILVDLKIPHKTKPYAIEMRSKESITQFRKKIGFIDGVKMTGNSRYWKGVEKNKVLDKILKSYSMKFKSRDPDYIISELKGV